MERMKKYPAYKEFLSLVWDILRSDEFKQMKRYRSHINSTLYKHSVKVAYLCFRYHKCHRMKMDAAELVRGALLHDFYLYDLHGDGEPHRLHWFHHPRAALENALLRYPALTEVQRDMIKNHMFPLTPCPPHTKAGWLICFYDKLAAITDRFGQGRAKRTKNKNKNEKKQFITFHKHFNNKTQKAIS